LAFGGAAAEIQLVDHRQDGFIVIPVGGKRCRRISAVQ